MDEKQRAALIAVACLTIVACTAIAVLWPPGCSTSPSASIAYSMLLAGCTE